MKRKLKRTTEQFVQECIDLFGNKFNFSKTKYIGVTKPIEIICKEHGSFITTPDKLFQSKHGCQTCALTYFKPREKGRTTQEFIEDAIKIHSNKYDYSKSNYLGAVFKLEIVCPRHGSFFQTPASHITGAKSGCRKCSNEILATKNSKRGKELFGKSQEWFIQKANSIHGETFDYSQARYTNYYTKVIVICKHHGSFKITPDCHLHGTGCRTCSKTRKFSQKAIKWLVSIEQNQNIFIQHAGNIGEYHIPNTNYNVDGFHKETNTIYEYYGDIWHGNLKKFNPEEKCHPFDKTISAGELNAKTIKREQRLISLGYNVVSVWENC